MSVLRLARSALPLLTAALLLAPAARATGVDGIVLPFKEVLVSSPVQGIIDRVAIREGDTVKEGQLLAQLHATQEELDMARAKAVVEKRQFDYRGAKRLFDDKIVPEDKEMEARIELELAQRQYEIAAESVRLRTITAPLSGIVVEKIREAGEAVNATQPMFRLIDIKRVYVQFFIRSEELSHFAVGQPLAATFETLNGGQPFVGKIDFIDPRVDASSGLMRVRVLIENPDQLIKAGMRGTVAVPAAK